MGDDKIRNETFNIWQRFLRRRESAPKLAFTIFFSCAVSDTDTKFQFFWRKGKCTRKTRGHQSDTESLFFQLYACFHVNFA